MLVVNLSLNTYSAVAVRCGFVNAYVHFASFKLQGGNYLAVPAWANPSAAKLVKESVNGKKHRALVRACNNARTVFNVDFNRIVFGVGNRAVKSYPYNLILAFVTLVIYARGSILTPKGRISVSLHREGNNVSCDLIIPENIDCVIENKDGYSYTRTF